MYHPRMIRVVFAEDNYLVREGTAALLATHGWAVGADDLTFLAPGPGGIEAIALLDREFEARVG